MKVTYQVLLDDPDSAKARIFVREGNNWPFPNLPAPDDAVTIDQTDKGWETISGAGDTAVNQWSPPGHTQPLKVDRVVYDPEHEAARVLFRSTGLHDPRPQIDVLEKSGFREV